MGEPTIVMRGKRVALGLLHSGLLPWLVRWHNVPQTEEMGGGELRPLAEVAVRADGAPLLCGERAGWAGFAIYRPPDLRPVGHANPRDWPAPHRTAEFGITIGDAGDRGGGYRTEATRLVLRRAFDEPGVHNVWLDTISTNVGAIRACERAGFREIGRIGEARRIGGAVADVVLMDCLATAFRFHDLVSPGEAGPLPAGSKARRPA